MLLKSISIAKRESWQSDPDKFTARCHIAGNTTYDADIHIIIPEDRLEPIVKILEKVIVEQMAEAAKSFREEVEASLLGPIVEYATLPSGEAS